MMPIMVWLLPEPDSPTTASVSPCLTSISMPLTAFTVPSGVVNSTLRSRTVRMVSGVVFISTILGIECITQPVAHKIKRKQGQHEEDRREYQEPRG